MRSCRSTLKWGMASALFAFSMEVIAGAAAPDISGIWSRLPQDAQGSSGSLRVDPPLKQKYLEAYKASKREAQGNVNESSGATSMCKYEGMPTMMAAREPLEILQTPGQVTVLAEYMTQTRRIYLDESLPAAENINPGYTGYSVGKWQGDTLEVQTIGIRDDVRYLDIPHSVKMKILEKIRLSAPGQLQDEITILDAGTLTRPYRLTFTYKNDSQHRIMEYVCDHKGHDADPKTGGGAKSTPSPGKPEPRSK